MLLLKTLYYLDMLYRKLNENLFSSFFLVARRKLEEENLLVALPSCGPFILQYLHATQSYSWAHNGMNVLWETTSILNEIEDYSIERNILRYCNPSQSTGKVTG